MEAGFKDTYLMHSQIVAVYSDPILIQDKTEFNSSFQDSFILDKDNELNNLFNLTSKRNEEKQNNLCSNQKNSDLAICHLKEDTLHFTCKGNTDYILIRGITLNKPFIASRSKNNPLMIDDCIQDEVKLKKDDLLLMGLNIKLKRLSDENMISIVREAVLKYKRKKSGVRRIGEELLSKVRCKIDEAVIIIASWILHNI